MTARKIRDLGPDEAVEIVAKWLDDIDPATRATFLGMLVPVLAQYSEATGERVSP